MDVVTAGEVALALVEIPAGEFLMGSGNEFFSETPEHHVRFEAGFWLGRSPVTQKEWVSVMGRNPSTFGHSPGQPIESISWDEAMEFCRRLSARSGRSFRLPSEAEWEYACRAGTTSDFFFGQWGPFADDSAIPSEVEDALCDYAWFDMNTSARPHPVGLKQPNPWGLHDMIGNVWEWCCDVWHDNYTAAPVDGSPWMDDEAIQPRRCLRGGAWDMNAFRCRSSYRSYDHRDLATDRFGFRVAMDAD